MTRSPCARAWLVGAAAVALTGASLTVSAPPAAAQDYTVRVTCKVPPKQHERKMARNWCMNYLPDGDQTFAAHVRNGRGNPVSGVTVRWTDRDNDDAYFRPKQTPCTTGPRGRCSAEIVDRHPRDREKFAVFATAVGSTGKGYLSFTK